MGHQQGGVLRRRGQVHTLADDLQGVDVQAAVRLVQQGEGGLQQEHLQDLEALFLAPAETVVQVAPGEVLAHAELFETVHEQGPELADRDFLAAPGPQGRAQEVGHRNAGHRHRILEAQEHAQASPFVGLEFVDRFAVKEDLTFDAVGGVAHDGGRQGRLAGTVGSHEGVHLAGLDLQIAALDDLLVAVIAGNEDPQVAAGEEGLAVRAHLGSSFVTPESSCFS